MESKEIIKKSTIFDIAKEHEELLSIIESEDGEIFEEVEKALQLNEEKLKNKSDSYVNICKKLKFEADIIDQEVKRLTALKKSREKKLDNLKKCLSLAMQKMDIKKIDTGLNKISLRNYPLLEIDPEVNIPEQYTRKKVIIDVDKVSLKKDVKSNKVKIEGVNIKDNYKAIIQ